MKISIFISKVFVLFCAFLFLFVGVSVSAHESGASFEKVIDGYKIDIGYDPEVFISGDTQRFDFDIFDSKTEKDVDFTDVWVNISEDKKTVFAGGIYKSDLGGAGMTYVFPKEGDYIISVRFEKNGNTITQSDFPVKVLANTEEIDTTKTDGELKNILIFGVLGAVLGFIVSVFFRKKSNNLTI